MKTVFPLSAVLLTGWIVSCTAVPDEAPPTPPSDVAQNRGALPEQPATGPEAGNGSEAAEQTKPEEEKITETVQDPKPRATEPKAAVPVARRVPGRDGFVFSPYNNKMINVKDFASGTMVADPTYPPAEKKYFRVP